MNQKTPRSAVFFMVGTVVAAILISLVAVKGTSFPVAELPLYVLLTVLGALANLYPVGSAQNDQTTYVLLNTFLFAGVMLLSPGWLTLMAVGVWVPMTVVRYQAKKPDWLLIPAANAGVSLIPALASHMVIAWWHNPLQPSPFEVGSLLWVIIGFVVFQTAWVSVVAHLVCRTPLRSLELWNRDALLADGLLLCLGAMMAMLWRAQPALMVLVMAPIAFAYYMMRGVQLIRLGELDGKTGLYNARRCQEQFEHELSTATFLRRSFSVVFFDLDFLRDINNNYGHLAGDAVIIEIARRLKENIRHGDFAARFGGEEFVLLMPGTEVREAHYVAEHVREAVASVPFDIGNGQRIRCTISGGVAAFPAHGRTVQELTASADEALYLAKRLGRNQIRTADERAGAEAGPQIALQQEAMQQVAVSSQEHVRPVLRLAHTDPARAQPAADGQTPTEQAEPIGPAQVGPTHSEAPAAKRARHQAVTSELLVSGLGLAVIPAIIPLGVSRLDVLLLAVLCALGFASEYWKVPLVTNGRGKSSVSLGVAVTMTAAATLGAYAAVAVNAVNFLAFCLQSRGRRWTTLAANLAIMTISAVASSLPFALLRINGLESHSWGMVAAVVGGVIYFGTNGGLVSMLVSRNQGTPLRRLWQEQFGWMAPSFIFTAATGGLMGSAYLMVGWQAFPVFALPLLIMRQTYHTHIKRSAEAYETAERGRRALEEAHDLQKRSLDQLIHAVSAIIDARDSSVSGHSWQVACYAVAIAEEMGLSPEEIALVRQGALLHDLGKVGIPESILNKPARLSPDEWEVMKQHTLIGERILGSVPGLEETAQMVGQHHEKYSGKGYPYGLSGRQIALGARITTLADSLDSMLSDRPYSRAKPLSWALEEIERCAGDHFDPEVVAAFRAVVAKKPSSFFVNSASVMGAYGMMEVAAASQA